MLPHDPAFPYRRHIVLLAIALGAFAALVWPGLDIGRRIAAPCAVILTSAIAYAFVLGMLKLLSYLPRIVFVLYSYAFFYGGIVSIVTYPFLVASVLADPGELSQFEKVLLLTGAVPLALAAAAGAYVAIDSQRDPAQQRAAGDVRNARA